MSPFEQTKHTVAPGAVDYAPPARPYDPLRFCIFTTVALLAWVLGAPAVVALMATIGLVAYWRAYRAGVLQTRCVLGDTRLVMLYLAAALVAGFAGVVVTW